MKSMIHFLRRKWQTLKKGSIAVGVSSVVIVAFGMNMAVIANKEAVKKDIILKTPQTEYVLTVALAKTPREQALGLMGIKSLREGEGMLFVFDKPKRVGFWMKNMQVPLDIFFIGTDKKINHIAEKVSPCPKQGFCPMYESSALVHYVLEVPSGYTKKNQIKIGDELILN